MPKKPSVIIINGKRFDTESGQQIGASKTSSQSIKPSGEQVIDGFRRRPNVPVFNKVDDSLSSVKPKLTTAKKHLIKPAQTVHHRTQRTETLMRRLVAKADFQKPINKRAQKPKARTSMLGELRLAKAMGIARNSTVSRFGNPIKSSSRGSSKFAAKPERILSGEIVSSKTHNDTAAAAAQYPQSLATTMSHQRLERMLDAALIRADAHKKALKGRLSANRGLWQKIKHLPTWFVVCFTIVAFLMAGGYFAWRNIPLLSMKVATLRTQIKGSIPAYVPSGFKFAGPIKYQNGALAINYQADGSRSFQIVQKASTWDSAALEANAVPHNSQMQTSQIKGTTVYIYGDENNATWVNNGVVYIINDKAQLGSEQLLKIADSL